MISEVVKYINSKKEEVLNEYIDNSQIPIVIRQSILIYQYLYMKHFNKVITREDVIREVGDDMGLIGYGKGCSTALLDGLFRNSNVMRSHAILHDAFGRFYNNYGKGRGYTYCIDENKTPTFIKKSPFCGQISGLIYCAYNRINL